MKTIRLGSMLILSVSLCTVGSSPAQEPANAEGERLFRTRCGSCHGAKDGDNRLGPHLSGLLGRQAGTVQGVRYSKALSSSGFVWDEERLHAYLSNPRQAVPGTTMTVNIRDEAQRSAIIAYLQNLPAAGQAGEEAGNSPDSSLTTE
ncbi:cytochrome C [Phyllobacterium phragmitis]|uniref:Cytochrome C n=1 Tax=Phyllobacterium phragmitis TaxID=2670329 RepID=A0A2S9IJC6_9HYPH|nr:c-type cytochrome [Phyllobacterium phragmitis]PRD40618.1 cytochrome C [Phyllobacterium phragmitis]